MSISVEIEGATEAASRLKEIGNSLSQAIGDALREAAESIVNDAQANAPVDTGFLRDSIEISGESETSVTVTSGAEYSVFVEYGTSKMSAQPFFEPAIEQAKAELQQALRDAISGNL